MASPRFKRNDGERSNAIKRTKIDRSSYAFLETINERELDFDLEKRCSVTLSSLNCYCCLICGKYLRGRRENSPAFLHSVNQDHHVFISFNSLKVYLLPDDVEVADKDKFQVLVRIRNAISPSFNREEIDNSPHECSDLNNQKYNNGLVGFNNNSSGNDSVNVIVLLLSHIAPVRDYFLLRNYLREDELVQKLGVVIRKLWSPNLFRPYVSSGEFLAYVSVVEPHAFGKVNDPKQIFLWLVNTLVKKSSELAKVLRESLQGSVEAVRIPIIPVLDSNGDAVKFERDNLNEKRSLVPFWLLTLDLPPTPLFKDNRNANDLPRVRIEDLLKKFEGKEEQALPQHLKKYKLIRYPQFLILHFNRFARDSLLPVKSRNQTLIEFPQELNLQDSKYTLIANIIHETVKAATFDDDDRSVWKIQFFNPKNDQWIELDGTLSRYKERELLFLQESYIQVWHQENFN